MIEPKRFSLGVCLGLTLAGCGESARPRPQWRVVVATDAQVPQFGERLLVELLDEQGDLACTACRRQLGAGRAADWPISFGVVAVQSPLRVRARLFRAQTLGADGSASSEAQLDTVVTLPPVASGVVDAVVPMPMRCFGVAAHPVDHLSCDPATGELADEMVADDAGLLVVDSWPPGVAAPCTGDVPDDMVCVPGGAFLLGQPSSIPFVESELQPTPERLVQVYPFALDRQEMTVGKAAELLALHPEIEDEPLARVELAGRKHCTYRTDGLEQEMPVSCVTRELADALCAAQNKRLPTEAEWEYAAGNRDLESRYPWGSDDDICDYAVVARGDAFDKQPTFCRDSPSAFLPVGPTATDPDDRDVSLLGIERLGGSLSEWVADDFSAFGSACWRPEEHVLVDPTCVADTMAAAVRGGSWGASRASARASWRQRRSSDQVSDEIGIRCAMDLP